MALYYLLKDLWVTDASVVLSESFQIAADFTVSLLRNQPERVSWHVELSATFVLTNCVIERHVVPLRNHKVVKGCTVRGLIKLHMHKKWNLRNNNCWAGHGKCQSFRNNGEHYHCSDLSMDSSPCYSTVLCASLIDELTTEGICQSTEVHTDHSTLIKRRWIFSIQCDLSYCLVHVSTLMTRWLSSHREDSTVWRPKPLHQKRPTIFLLQASFYSNKRSVHLPNNANAVIKY